MNNTVLVKTNSPVPMQKEAVFTVAVSPGLALRDDPSNVGQKTLAIAGAQAPLMIAKENSVIGGGINDAYAIGDTGQFYIPQKGEEFRLRFADAVTVALDAKIQVASSGGLFEVGATNPVAIAREAKTTSAANGDLTVICEVL